MSDYAERLYTKMQNLGGKGAALDARDHKVVAQLRIGFGIDPLTSNRTNWHNEANVLAEMYDAGEADAPQNDALITAADKGVSENKTLAAMVQLFFMRSRELSLDAAHAVMTADKSSAEVAASEIAILQGKLEYLSQLAVTIATTPKRKNGNA